MIDPVLIERSDLESLAELLISKSSDKAIRETLQTIGVKPRDINRTLDGVEEVMRFCREKNVKIGRHRILQNIPWRREKETGRYQFKEKDVLKYLNK
jgi:hypothetical protein